MFCLWTICIFYYCDSWFTNGICDRATVWHITVSVCWLLGQTESPPPRTKTLCSWYMTWLSTSNGYHANQAHSQCREMDWPYLHMNQWVGHTLIAMAGAEPVPLTQLSSLFPSSPKVLLPPHKPSPFSLQEPPSQTHSNYHACTGGERTRATRARPSRVPVASHGMGEARGALGCAFQRIPLLRSLLYQGKASSHVRSQGKSGEIVPWTRKKEYDPFK